MAILPPLNQTVEKLVTEFDSISDERKIIIGRMAAFIKDKLAHGGTARLNFICTHNSRRSHISQIWAQCAAYYYGVANIETYSGGTEATAFNPKAVESMRDAGFEITTKNPGSNPAYDVRLANDAPPLRAFSKRFDDKENPAHDFAAIMVCSDADEGCPVVPGSSARISLTYEDPKNFDNTPQEKEKYKERVHQIGREMLFAFSLI